MFLNIPLHWKSYDKHMFLENLKNDMGEGYQDSINTAKTGRPIKIKDDDGNETEHRILHIRFNSELALAKTKQQFYKDNQFIKYQETTLCELCSFPIDTDIRYVNSSDDIHIFHIGARHKYINLIEIRKDNEQYYMMTPIILVWTRKLDGTILVTETIPIRMKPTETRWNQIHRGKMRQLDSDPIRYLLTTDMIDTPQNSPDDK